MGGKPRPVKCPWCGAMVALTAKGACAPHRHPSRRVCVGVGIPLSTMHEYLRLIDVLCRSKKPG